MGRMGRPKKSNTKGQLAEFIASASLNGESGKSTPVQGNLIREKGANTPKINGDSKDDDTRYK